LKLTIKQTVSKVGKKEHKALSLLSRSCLAILAHAIKLTAVQHIKCLTLKH